MVERARIGIKVIDSLIEGGIPRKMSVAVQGPSGNEKYDLALSFLKEGIRKGEAVVIALSSISPEEFKRGMHAVGIDPEDLEKKGLLRIIDWYSHKEKAIIDIEEDGGVLRCSVDLINVGIAFSRAIADLDESTKKRAVVEILSPALNEYDVQKVYGFAQSTKAKLEKMGFTSLFLVEKEMHDSVTLSTLLQPFDGVIDIERSREGDRIVRKVGALSMKDTTVDSNYVPLPVSDSGIREDAKEQKAKEAPEKAEDVPETESPQLWFDLGTRLLLQGEPKRALKCFDKILSTNPSHVGAWASKANTLKELGRTDEATECYKQALVHSTRVGKKPEETAPPETEEPGRECSYCSEIIPSGTKFCDNCGMNESTVNIGGMDINRIMRVCNVKLDRNPEDADALFVKGATYEKIGNHERAIEVLDRLTDLDPRYPGVWILKAKVHARMGDGESAIKCREMALSYDKEEVVREEAVREQQYECPMCGQSVSESAAECENCGARFDASSLEAPEPIAEPTEIEVPKPAVDDKREMLRREIAELKSRKPRMVPEGKEAPREKEPAPSPAHVGLTNGLVRKSVGRGPGRTNGLTNGKGRGRTNGLTNGRGRTNGLTNGRGRTNGLTNGRGRTNGLTNGRGRTNGLVNGLRGRVNGLTNGLVNGVGRVNGLTNGLVNGLGRVNGVTNGIVNGFRSTRAGLTNGVTNGLGLTNGLGGLRFSSEAKFSRWKVLLIPLIAVALLMSSLFGPVGEDVATMGSIRIDGQFSDWTDASRMQSSDDFMINPNIDIIETAVENNVEYVSFYLSVSGSVLQGEPITRRADTVHIFIDVDRSYGTGYQIRGIGADFIIEVYGTNGEVALSRLMRFDTNRGQEDWNSWLSEVSVHSEVTGQNLETQVYWPTIAAEPTTIDVLFHTKSWNDHEDFADFISSNSEGVLLVRQRSGIQNDILTGVNQVLLEVDLFAVDTDIEVQSIEVAITGTAEYADVSAVKLVDLGGTPVSQRIWMGPTVIFDAPITIQSQEMERYHVVADIASTGSGNTMGASIPHTGAVTLTSGVVTVERVAATLDVGYIEVIPSDIVIDGGFADWLGMSLDSNDEPETSLIQSIDIRSYDAANDNTSASFYLKVDEEVFGGTSVPYDTPTIPTGGGPVIIDSDRDSVPDNVDGPNGDGTRPFDFDNDGVLDVQTGYDYDGDGETDHPFGNDEWLQTTIPADYPAAYANVTVTIFIGPRAEPVILGEDTSLIFIDTNETSGTGYSIGPVYTEYMIQVRGKNGHIISSELFEHTGTSPGQWIWSSLGNADAGTDYSQLEVQVPLTVIGLLPGDGFGAYFYTSAWSQAGEDYSDDALSNITTRSVPESRTRHFADGNGGYGLVAPDGGTIDITIDGEINETNENDWTSTAKTDTYGSNIKTYVVYNSTDLFVAVESLSQGTGSGSSQDYAEIAFDTNHDGGTSPQTDDYKFRVGNVNVNELKNYTGTGSGWGETLPPSSSWDGAMNDTDTYITYEFQIPLEYVFNTSVSDGHIGGFCVHVHNNTGDVYYYWPDATGSGETNSREDTPNDWGDLFYKRPRLVINEVSPNTTSEWVELYNGGDSIDINGIVLSDQDGFTWTRSSSLVIPNGVYLTLMAGSGTDDTDFSDGNGTLYIGTTEFNNIGDDVLLKYGGNDMGFDYMQYGSGGDIQSCPSDPASENSWTGTLTAPSGTDSAGRDKSSSDTNAASDWDNTGGPDVNQRTRGHVNYLASLTVTGEDQAPANVQQGQTLVVMLNLTLSANYGWIEVTEIDVNRTGTSSTEIDIAAATLWLDEDEDGEYDSGTDTFIKTGTYSNGNYTFSSLSIHVQVNSPMYLLVIYNISSSANTGVTVGAQVDGESNVTVTSPDSVAAFSEINSTNSTIQGNQLSVSGTDKAPASVGKGQTEVVMLSLNLSTTYGSITLTQIEVNRTGTSTTESDISQATLWDDVNNNGAYDSPPDTCLAVGSYSGGFYTFSSLSFAVNAGTNEFLLVVYNISATANTGVTVGARINGSSNITVQSPDTVASFSPIQSTNSTISAATVTVQGTDKAPATVEQGQTAVVMLNLTLTADYGTATLTAMDVNRTGTSTTEADISEATLWHDVNDDGDYDAGTDVCLGSGTYSNGNYTFSGLSFDITAGTPERLLVMYNVSSSSNTGVTVGARIDGADNITLSGSDTVAAFSPIQSTNSTINANQLDVYGGDIAFSVVFQGEDFAEMLNLTLSTDYGSVTVTQINVTKTGTSSQSSDIDAAVLYEDVNGDGDYDSGTDTYIATGSFSSGVYTFSSLSISVSAGADKDLLVMYNISASATHGVTVGAKINGAGDITVQSPDSVASFSAISSTNAIIRDSDVFVLEVTGEVYESTDGGKSFSYKGDATADFVAICINRSNNNLYAFVNNGSVYRSTDKGQNWVYRGDAFGGAPAGIDMTIDSNDYIYLLQTDGDVYLSTDGGANFAIKGDAGAGSIGIEANYSNDDLYVVETDGDVVYSSDGGDNWSPKGDASSGNDVKDIAIDSNGYVYVLEGSGEVYRSTDYGDTFSQMGDIGTDTYNGICIDTRYDYIYVIEDTGQVYLSVDSGGNWTLRSDIGSESDYEDITCQVNVNVLEVYGGDIAYSVVFRGEDFAEMLNLTLATDSGPITVTQINVTKTGTSTQSGDIDSAILYEDVNGDGDYDSGTDTYIATATYSSGVYTFSGLSITVNGGTDKDLLVMYNISATATLGVTVGAKINGAGDITVQSPDSVASFSAISSTNAIIRDSDVFVLEVTGEVYESTDGGKSFSYKGDATAGFVAICINRSNSDLYAFVNNGSVYRSTDKGQNWVHRGDAFGGGPTGIDLTIDSNDYIYLLQTDGDVYLSTDGGANFAIKGDAGAGSIGIEANYSNDDLYVVETDGGVVYSSDGGDNWSSKGDASSDSDVEDIAIDSNGYVYVLEGSGEVYRSTDYGDTFSQMGDIGTDTYNGICIDTRYDYIYVIEDTGQVYMSIDSGANWTLRSDIGSESDYEDITCYVVPEFSEIVAALVPILILLLVAIRRRRRDPEDQPAQEDEVVPRQ